MIKGMKTFTEFFPVYLAAHSKPATQKMHALALVLAFAYGLFCILTARWAWLPGALAIGYGFAWSGHLLFEKNNPLFFKYPYWSFLAEFKMSFMVLTGKL